MHELSIAMGIVEIVSEESQRLGDVRITAVHVKLGALSGVVKEALLFSWDLACENTDVAGAKLAIEEVPVRIWCSACAQERTIDGPIEMRCPACGAAAHDVRSGREMQVSALEIEDT
jgi:hydrogenase nickel incorporation protein HypA/HybF